jgi:predicted CXXCH cytochrome family protein
VSSRLRAIALGVSLSIVAASASGDIGNTLHNFTPSGPGTIKNTSDVGLCVYCHAPHRAGQTRALWNRNLSAAAYDPYTSSTLRANVGQPTGSSRLCLSCHDGTIALGNVLHAPGQVVDPIAPLQGRARLGTDLFDDHPVSFVYDDALAAANGELNSPAVLTGAIRLDRNGELQCTTCHDPHQDANPKFLVTSNRDAALCVTCHAKRGWTGSSHATSQATWNGQGTDPWPGSAFHNVAENGCLSCHDPHSAAHPERLLAREPTEQVCLACHNGNVARTRVDVQLQKPEHHPVVETSGIHDPAEDPRTMSRHAFCADCHNPHAVSAATAQAPDVAGKQRFVTGLDTTGTPIPEARAAFEVCLKCHGVTAQPTPRVVRLDHETNVRLETHPGNLSFHPITAVGTNPSVQTLIPPLTPSSRIYCHDCHNTNDARNPLPSTARGPHGSIHAPILEREYSLADPTSFDTSTYAMCFKCHDYDVLRDDAAFPHKKHLENADAPCAACHDPHGSRSSTHLINFLSFDVNGSQVVRPSQSTGRLEFQDLGNGEGRCYLTCHGEDHCPREYQGPDKSFIGSCP